MGKKETVFAESVPEMGALVARAASVLEAGEEAVAIAVGRGQPMEGAVAFAEMLSQFRAQELAPLFANDLELKRFVGRQGQELIGRLLTLANGVLLRLEETLLSGEPMKLRDLLQTAELIGRYITVLQKHTAPPAEAPASRSDAELEERLARAQARIARAKAEHQREDG
jgi:hypothetical protein